ncbi:MAG: PHP domain-containing protein [Gemmatimonadetes bacterium]|nr:PHP domain-containing protein [Gemmatimonadota bacterium]
MNSPPGADFALPWTVEVDLHLHTTASDGLLTPAELVERVAGTPLQVIAVADHDSTEAIDDTMQAVRRHPGLTLIPAVEIGTEDDEAELHLLGYFIDHRNAPFEAALRHLRHSRTVAARRTVERLAELGMPVSWERVQELAPGVVGRPHIARAMVEEGYVQDVHEAFDRYLGDDGVARVPREKLSPLDGLRLVHRAGGVGVVAHPRTVDRLKEHVAVLAAEGLVGIEVYAERYTAEQRERYAALADRYGLVHSGGSDYHGFGTEGEVLPGQMGPPRDTPARLLERARALHGDGVGWIPADPLEAGTL